MPSSSDATPERSVIDSGFSRTANYIMKTAMKLPPHILPTLDEIASTTPRNPPEAPKEEYRTVVGVYVPGGRKDIGVYVPRNKRRRDRDRDVDKFKREVGIEEEEDYDGDFEAIPVPSHFRGGAGGPRQRRFNQKRRRKFKIPFDPKRPLNLVSSLGSKIKEVGREVKQKLRSSRANGSRRRRKQNKRRGGQRRRKSHYLPPPPPPSPSRSRPPYKFAEPDYTLPALPEYQNSRESPPLPPPRQNAVEPATPVPQNPYVPKFVKELLAKTFLKNPDAYIRYLRETEERKKKGLLGPKGAPIGYIDWIDNEPYYKTPPPPTSSSSYNSGLTSQEVRDLEDELLALVAPPRGRPQRPFRPTRAPPLPPPPNKRRRKRKNEHFASPTQRYPPSRRRPPPFDTPLNKHFPVPKNHLLQAWKDPFYSTHPTPTTPTTTPPTAFTPSPHDEYDYYDYAEATSFVQPEPTSSASPSGGDRDYPLGRRNKRKKAKVGGEPAERPFYDYTDHVQAPTFKHQTRATPEPTPSSSNPTRSTICICCGEASTPRHRHNHSYNRRTLQVEDDAQMEALLTERALIEREVDCAQMEPVEVVLIFDSQKVNGNGLIKQAEEDKRRKRYKPPTFQRDKVKKTKRPAFSTSRTTPSSVRLTPDFNDVSATGGSSYGYNGDYYDNNDYTVSLDEIQKTAYYDPTKLTFIFSTPSPLRKKYIEIRDRMATEEDGRGGEEVVGGRRSSSKETKAGVYFEPASSERVPYMAQVPSGRGPEKTPPSRPKSLRDLFPTVPLKR